MTRLSDDTVQAALSGSQWSRDGDAITRALDCGDFAGAMGFAARVGELAEAANHHPDILIHGYSRVRLTLSTHSAGGITQADLDLARQIDDAA
ncbi:MAG: 4a-hydroxytetrahydrobiopterin dehydratase [Solirubrobacteraceae bacterium]|jgi:4a-hydroxytetrahydrobiopterin dehydratase|nr:4a-hydroxytetrahydrobiopterin dehydratase [Solirubrobacteraceae bacterium]